MSTFETVPPMPRNDYIQFQTQELSRLLGCDCFSCICSESADFTLHTIPSLDERFQEQAEPLRRCLSRAASLQSECLERIDSNMVCFAIPIECDDFLPWFCVGIFQSSCQQSAERLIRAANNASRLKIESDRQRDAMECASRHMAQVMREQAWLRDLASHTRLEQTRLGIDDVGQTVFEPLRRVIQAEAVGLYADESLVSDHRQLQSQCHGTKKWNSEDLAGLLKHLQLPRPGSVQAYSNLAITLSGGLVRSAMIASIDADERHVYLVAINHVDQAEGPTKGSFGAHELGLLHEAAFYLASHTSNLRTLMESEQLVLGTLQAMSQAIEARDPYTRGHSDRVAKMAYEIAGLLDLPETEREKILLSGVLHDVGKIGVPDSVLMKPGKLTDEERLIIEKHPEIGHGILEKLGKLRFALPGVLYHHERWDGMGYPHRLRGEEIPLMARILAVADAFDAMTSSRPYRVGMRMDKTRAIMMEGAGKQWDQEIIGSFWNWVDRIQKPGCNDPILPQAIIEDTQTNVFDSISILQQVCC